jgi:hypothetical protein
MLLARTMAMGQLSAPVKQHRLFMLLLHSQVLLPQLMLPSPL